jgi:hypothetical protein
MPKASSTIFSRPHFIPTIVSFRENIEIGLYLSEVSYENEDKKSRITNFETLMFVFVLNLYKVVKVPAADATDALQP